LFLDSTLFLPRTSNIIHKLFAHPSNIMFFTSLLLLLPVGLVASAPLADICAEKGYDLGKHPAFWVGANATISTPGGCKSLCTSEKCTSFAVGAGSCLLYNVTVTGYVSLHARVVVSLSNAQNCIMS
jgi:hypothetical protein